MKSLFQLLFLATCLCSSMALQAQNLYFPPLLGNTWDQMPTAEAGYCEEGLESLDSLLEAQNSKAFILLKDGKIVHERYFGTFAQDSFWVWNSAGKTMTAALVGVAQQEGSLSIEDKSSDYLGQGWTSAPPAKEDLITLRHQLTMTSGLDDTVGDVHCTDPSCLNYLADADTRWAYHNAPYTILDQVLEAATGENLNALYASRIRNKTGMTGLYLKIGFNNVLATKPRSMARFGLLMLSGGAWNGTSILTDPVYVSQMTASSQSINPSYGYLWWLNGKPKYRLPGSQFDFQGPISPSAPLDAYAALGKDGQILTVIPSTNEVWVRMGEAPPDGGQVVANVVFEDISKALEEARCMSSSVGELSPKPNFILQTNPVHNLLQLQSVEDLKRIEILDANGRRILSKKNDLEGSIDVSALSQGTYTIVGWQADGQGSTKQFLKL